jgi:hypothetical protein
MLKYNFTFNLVSPSFSQKDRTEIVILWTNGDHNIIQTIWTSRGLSLWWSWWGHYVISDENNTSRMQTALSDLMMVSTRTVWIWNEVTRQMTLGWECSRNLQSVISTITTLSCVTERHGRGSGGPNLGPNTAISSFLPRSAPCSQITRSCSL